MGGRKRDKETEKLLDNSFFRNLVPASMCSPSSDFDEKIILLSACVADAQNKNSGNNSQKINLILQLQEGCEKVEVSHLKSQKQQLFTVFLMIIRQSPGGVLLKEIGRLLAKIIFFCEFKSEKHETSDFEFYFSKLLDEAQGGENKGKPSFFVPFPLRPSSPEGNRLSAQISFFLVAAYFFNFLTVLAPKKSFFFENNEAKVLEILGVSQIFLSADKKNKEPFLKEKALISLSLIFENVFLENEISYSTSKEFFNFLMKNFEKNENIKEKTNYLGVKIEILRNLELFMKKSSKIFLSNEQIFEKVLDFSVSNFEFLGNFSEFSENISPKNPTHLAGDEKIGKLICSILSFYFENLIFLENIDEKEVKSLEGGAYKLKKMDFYIFLKFIKNEEFLPKKSNFDFFGRNEGNQNSSFFFRFLEVLKYLFSRNFHRFDEQRIISIFNFFLELSEKSNFSNFFLLETFCEIGTVFFSKIEDRNLAFRIMESEFISKNSENFTKKYYRKLIFSLKITKRFWEKFEIFGGNSDERLELFVLPFLRLFDDFPDFTFEFSEISHLFRPHFFSEILQFFSVLGSSPSLSPLEISRILNLLMNFLSVSHAELDAWADVKNMKNSEKNEKNNLNLNNREKLSEKIFFLSSALSTFLGKNEENVFLSEMKENFLDFSKILPEDLRASIFNFSLSSFKTFKNSNILFFSENCEKNEEVEITNISGGKLGGSSFILLSLIFRFSEKKRILDEIEFFEILGIFKKVFAKRTLESIRENFEKIEKNAEKDKFLNENSDFFLCFLEALNCLSIFLDFFEKQKNLKMDQKIGKLFLSFAVNSSIFCQSFDFFHENVKSSEKMFLFLSEEEIRKKGIFCFAPSEFIFLSRSKIFLIFSKILKKLENLGKESREFSEFLNPKIEKISFLAAREIGKIGKKNSEFLSNFAFQNFDFSERKSENIPEKNTFFGENFEKSSFLALSKSYEGTDFLKLKSNLFFEKKEKTQKTIFEEVMVTCFSIVSDFFEKECFFKEQKKMMNFLIDTLSDENGKTFCFHNFLISEILKKCCQKNQIFVEYSKEEIQKLQKITKNNSFEEIKRNLFFVISKVFSDERGNEKLENSKKIEKNSTIPEKIELIEAAFFEFFSLKNENTEKIRNKIFENFDILLRLSRDSSVFLRFRSLFFIFQLLEHFRKMPGNSPQKSFFFEKLSFHFCEVFKILSAQIMIESQKGPTSDFSHLISSQFLKMLFFFIKYENFEVFLKQSELFEVTLDQAGIVFRLLKNLYKMEKSVFFSNFEFLNFENSDFFIQKNLIFSSILAISSVPSFVGDLKETAQFLEEFIFDFNFSNFSGNKLEISRSALSALFFLRDQNLYFFDYGAKKGIFLNFLIEILNFGIPEPAELNFFSEILNVNSEILASKKCFFSLFFQKSVQKLRGKSEFPDFVIAKNLEISTFFELSGFKNFISNPEGREVTDRDLVDEDEGIVSRRENSKNLDSKKKSKKAEILNFFRPSLQKKAVGKLSPFLEILEEFENSSKKVENKSDFISNFSDQNSIFSYLRVKVERSLLLSSSLLSHFSVEMQGEGIRILEEIIETFKDFKDSDGEFLLSQFCTQISMTLRAGLSSNSLTAQKRSLKCAKKIVFSGIFDDDFCRNIAEKFGKIIERIQEENQKNIFFSGIAGEYPAVNEIEFLEFFKEILDFFSIFPDLVPEKNRKMFSEFSKKIERDVAIFVDFFAQQKERKIVNSDCLEEEKKDFSIFLGPKNLFSGYSAEFIERFFGNFMISFLAFLLNFLNSEKKEKFLPVAQEILIFIFDFCDKNGEEIGGEKLELLSSIFSNLEEKNIFPLRPFLKVQIEKNLKNIKKSTFFRKSDFLKWLDFSSCLVRKNIFFEELFLISDFFLNFSFFEEKEQENIDLFFRFPRKIQENSLFILSKKETGNFDFFEERNVFPVKFFEKNRGQGLELWKLFCGFLSKNSKIDLISEILGAENGKQSFLRSSRLLLLASLLLSIKKEDLWESNRGPSDESFGFSGFEKVFFGIFESLKGEEVGKLIKVAGGAEEEGLREVFFKCFLDFLGFSFSSGGGEKAWILALSVVPSSPPSLKSRILDLLLEVSFLDISGPNSGNFLLQVAEEEGEQLREALRRRGVEERRALAKIMQEAQAG